MAKMLIMSNATPPNVPPTTRPGETSLKLDRTLLALAVADKIVPDTNDDSERDVDVDEADTDDEMDTADDEVDTGDEVDTDDEVDTVDDEADVVSLLTSK